MRPGEQQSGFGELPQLVSELRQHFAEAAAPRGDPPAAPTELLERLNTLLAAAEQRCQQTESVLDSAWDAFVAMDAAGRIVQWNRQAERTFGWPREEVLGRLVAEIVVPPQHRSAHRAGLARFLATGEGAVLNQRLEVTALRRDGSEFPAELTILEPQRDGDSFVFNAFVRDISRRKAAADALASSESLYHSLVDRLPINVTRKDLAGRITFVNQPFCNLAGRTSEELLGKTDFDLSPPELAEKYRRDDARVAASGAVFHAIEENCIAGRSIFFEVWKIPVRDAAGQVVETQAVFWDVTEREENRISLARERDLLRTLMDNLPDLIYVKDADGRYVTVNRSLLQLWGNPPLVSIAGKTPYDFVRADLAARYAAEDREVLEQDRPIVDSEEQVIAPSGEQLVYAATKIPLHDPQGRVTGLVGIDRDVTRRKRAEQELREARRVADAANQAKSDFLANMSHEIRTPLNAVIGITDLLLAGELAPGQREYLEIVRDSGESLMVVINDILDFSKIEAGQLELESQVFHLADAIGGAMKALALRAHAKGLELACDVDPQAPEFIFGDAVRLRQIVTNLVGNAIKFTERGEVVVRVEQQDEQGRRSNDGSPQVALRFSVRDTGIGIPADKVDHVFKAFAQADASTTRRFGGTGLGLAISTRLVEAMGGKIQLRSSVGEGSEFSFTLDFRLATAHDVDEKPLSAESLAGRKVLVVDDNATNRRILVAMLQSLGMQPVAADGATEALAQLAAAHQRAMPFELIVTDVNMPEIDGFMLAERIRQQTAWPQPAMIALTSGPRPNDDERSRQFRVAAHLMKPIKRSELCRAIQLALSPAIVVAGGQPGTEGLPGKSSPDKPPEPPAPRKLHILLAEDSPMNQVLAVGVLKREGHTIMVANNGRDAVAACLANEFDLVLMDVEMPEMDGLEATAAIREREAAGYHVPILAMTAHAMSGVRERCLLAGMDGYLSKPIRIHDLVRAIDDLAQKSCPAVPHDR